MLTSAFNIQAYEQFIKTKHQNSAGNSPNMSEWDKDLTDASLNTEPKYMCKHCPVDT